jgi:hypothetical protein
VCAGQHLVGGQFRVRFDGFLGAQLADQDRLQCPGDRRGIGVLEDVAADRSSNGADIAGGFDLA